MRKAEFPVVKDIVLLGGGHAHVSVLRSFGMKPIKGVRISLISTEVDTPYSGMLPGLIAGHYTFDEAHIDLGPLARFANARYLQTSAVKVDPLERLVHCADGRPPVPYDVLSINTGSTPIFDPTLELDREVIPVKPVSGFLKHWESLKERVITEPTRRIGIVGAGAGGIELLLSMQYALAREVGAEEGLGPGQFHVFTRDDAILKTHGAKVRESFEQVLSTRNVAVHHGFDVRRADASGISDGSRVVALDEVIWVTGAQPPEWFAESGFDVDSRGFLAVDDRLRVRSHPDVFGAGDAVSMVRDPRPKSGVFAVRQGPVLAHNLRAQVLAQPLKPYRPQRSFLSLISTGNKFAIASYSGRSVAGEWVWRWKDHIDRSFMDRFNKLPVMTEKPDLTTPVVANLPAEIALSQAPDAMRCGGCGAKVGAATLTRALAGLHLTGVDSADEAKGIRLGIGDDAAVIDVPAGQLLVQTVDSFPAMIEDPFVFGRIAANHCLGDIYAMGAKPHSALVTVSLPFAADAKREGDLIQLLGGVQAVLYDAGCTIVGGHTSEGSELTVGLTINGLGQPGALLEKGALEPGLALILTKPIGSGALFAAHGRGQTKGRFVNGAIANALRSSSVAAEILLQHDAKAMTDVTGFGLVGHLSEMVQRSQDVAAILKLTSVPLLSGAVEAVAEGIVSSLQAANLALRPVVQVAHDVSSRPEFQLLFDPQTAGGLLAAVPMARANETIVALRQANYPDAAIIGETSKLKVGGLSLGVI